MPKALTGLYGRGQRLGRRVDLLHIAYGKGTDKFASIGTATWSSSYRSELEYSASIEEPDRSTSSAPGPALSLPEAVCR